MSNEPEAEKPKQPGYPALVEQFRERIRKGVHVLTSPLDYEVGATPKDLVFQDGKLRVFRYKPVAKQLISPPVVISYALVNRYYMIDLQPDRSMVRELLARGVDIYVIDWGYPSPLDRFLTIEDYVDGQIAASVDAVCEAAGVDRVNLLGICQGGTFALMYAALYPDKVRNLITMVTPMDFDTDTGLLNVWSHFLDVDQMVGVLGNIPGDFMNVGFLMLNPPRLMFDKYRGFVEHLDDPKFVSNFIRMERWIFDSPDQAGEAFRRFIKELYQENRLVKGEFELDGRKVDLKQIKAPLLNIYGAADHLVPPACSMGIADAVGSDDTETIEHPSGHIGVFVSGRSEKILFPRIAEWIRERSTAPGDDARPPATAKKTSTRKQRARRK